MKLNKNLLTFLIIGTVILYLLNYRLTTPSSRWTVYGTTECGWTRKQLQHMKDNRISHTFVNCDEENCGNIQAYPTLKDPSGQMIVGFKQVQ
jgi:hypothetical protein